MAQGQARNLRDLGEGSGGAPLGCRLLDLIVPGCVDESGRLSVLWKDLSAKLIFIEK